MFTRFHRDEDGTISILSVFAVLVLTMLLGMVMNVGRQVDGKIRLQNAADAAAYSGGVTLARGMNSLVFTNHLLCDVFANTAWLREARDQNSASYVPSILAAWAKEGPVFSRSRFPKFHALGPAISQEVPLQQNLVTAFGVWAKAVSDAVLPLMEQILSEELIPQYQRAVVAAFPDIAQNAAMQTALQNGQPDFGRGNMLAALWRSSGQLVGGENELADSSLPVVDPEQGTVANLAQYADKARQQRQWLATLYLNDWNNQTLAFFDQQGKMSQFSALWRSFTCGYLKQLLEQEYPDSNLPFVIHAEANQIADGNAELDQHFTFLAVAYWKKTGEFAPKLFASPIASDPVAYAQVRVFIPRPRLVWAVVGGGGGGGTSPTPIGGVPTDLQSIGQATPPQPGQGGAAAQWAVGREGVPFNWNLLDQRWDCQLTPATTSPPSKSALAAILQTTPALPAFAGQNVTLPTLGGLNSQQIESISPH